ncbi:ABC transporter ATP-binding protein [Clostridium weizhouense]|uniref:ABC transporter ATP-binding protein n=1 Tax=Clostridium weizhouense TaxID=2859781 RepID=A0ABS7AV77_9CLOT|nr:ABC transporter ATP-binding protein [Clostridium weizhouense]MBW6411735.1 ABC transporter ATP-binding protein [Clostridium weizhouense]
MKLKVEDLSYKICEDEILSNINIEINKGDFVGLIGPNGCGKSTLLKNIYRVYKPYCGGIFIDDISINKLNNKDIAKRMSVMVQENNIEFDINVLDMVLLGRYSHKKLLENNSNEDFFIARQSLKEVGLSNYEDRSFLSLSGGEKQRVLIARALAQKAEFIILDEPTNHLDIGYQFQIMDILKKQEITVFSSIHDLNIACFYCDKLFVMDNGKIIDYGTPEQVITNDLIKKLFRVNANIRINSITNKISITYLPNII